MTNTLPDIKKEIILNAPIDKVWNLITTAEGFASWFMPITGELILEEGHTVQITSPFGDVAFKIVHIDAMNEITYSWDTEGWFATFELAEVDGGTKFTITHGGWGEPDTVVAKAGKTNSEIHTLMNGGWDMIVNFKLKMAAEM